MPLSLRTSWSASSFALALLATASPAWSQTPAPVYVTSDPNVVLSEQSPGTTEQEAIVVPEPAMEQAVPAEAAPPPAPSFDGPLWERTKLTGDWHGWRSCLQSQGITLDISNTQYYQGVTDGGLEQAFQYGGRNDYFMNFDGEKLGFSKGSFLTVHAETRYGETVNSLTGAALPANLALALPKSDGMVTSITGVKLTQFLSESKLVFAGKINTFDDFKQQLTGAGMLNGFQNAGLMFNPVYLRTVPYSTFGAGFVALKNMEPVFTLAAFDTNDHPTTSGFDTFFSNGVTILSAATLPTEFFGLAGHQGVSGTYSTGTYTNLSPSVYFDPSGGIVVSSPPQTGSWSLAYNADQAFYVSAEDPRKRWGVFTNAGIADNNPSPVRWFANVGISGTSPFACRTSDTFGAGYYYMGLSNELKDLAPVLLPLRDERGLEFYYNYAVNPWFQITPDLQVVTPFRERVEHSLVFGLRAKIDF